MSKLLIPVNNLPVHCGDGEILLTTAGLDVLSEMDNTAVEAERAARLEQRSGLRFLAARRLLRKVLSGLLNVPPDKVEIIVGEGGKPRLADHRYHFSIAHTGDTVGIAVARSSVGLDLEHMRSVDERGLSKRFFSESEAVLFAEKSDQELFFTLWTCREAAIKGDGRGLAALLSITRVSPFTEDPREVLIGEDLWMAAHWTGEGGLHGAVAFPRDRQPRSISWCDLRGKDIL